MKHPGVYFLIFAVSGFSGLIYESIWTHYLKLFLGHSAHAQTLVLVIFMGGMALGAAVCSRYSGRWRNLLLGYAVVEGIIGLCALAYHPLFDWGVSQAYGSVFPALGSRTAVTIFKWSVSTLSILPQSILLGMTFPLMSGAFLRLFPRRSGTSLAMLYFANSIGAVFGVLASGFVLIKAVGFPGTIMTAGLLNIALAIVVWLLSRGQGEHVDTVAAEVTPAETGTGDYRLLLLVSLGTGLASFIYEIGWIRMLALVLGSSTHAFELMLSAFLLGLACGGLWIKRRIDSLDNPIRTLAIIQVTMGMLALATLPLYNGTFSIMLRLLAALPKTGTGYLFFNLGSHAIASVIMLPATFCAGMTLPLITNILFRRGHGEKSIGAVYAANTVGAIIGVFAAVHLGLPLLGLQGLLETGVALDMGLGLLLIWSAAARCPGRRLPATVTAGCLVAMVLAVTLVRLDTYKMASGVYRRGVPLLTPEKTPLVFHRDGKTATVSVVMFDKGEASIRSNGKSDSNINLDPAGPVSSDEPTTVLLGALPLMFKPDARTVANIGLGTGMTTQTLLTNPAIERVDTIEIEPAMVEGARRFRSRSPLVFDDPRSRIIIDDAKSVFSTRRARYDLIISEPSNPWVSGVASLFTTEFYRHVSRYLNDDGLYVQWLQLYEMDTNLVISVLKALSANFADYGIYLTASNSDIVVVARKRGELGPLRDDILAIPAMRALLARNRVNGLQDIGIRQIGTKKYLDPLLATYAIGANSDYYPVLDQLAARARFLGTGASSFLRLATGPIPLTHLIAPQSRTPLLSAATPAPGCDMSFLARRGIIVRDYLLGGEAAAPGLDDESIVSPATREAAVNLRRTMNSCRGFTPEERRDQLMAAVATMVPYLTADELAPVWDRFDNGPCRATLTPLEREYLAFYRALARRDHKSVVSSVDRLLATDTTLDRNGRIYLAAMGMVGAVVLDDRAQSRRFYDQVFTTREQPDLSIRLLLANSL